MGLHRLQLRIAFRTAGARRAFVDALRAKVLEHLPDREDELRDADDGEPGGRLDCRWAQLISRNAVRQWIADYVQANATDVRGAEVEWHDCGEDEVEPLVDPETGESLPSWHPLRQAFRASRDCSQRSHGGQRVGGLTQPVAGGALRG